MNIEKAKEIINFLVKEIENYGEEYSGAYLPELYEIQKCLLDDKELKTPFKDHIMSKKFDGIFRYDH